VVDNIVYDCLEFLKEHPGGEQIIRSFSGAECSWQFWRFHSKKEMEEFGKPLRVGRTDGMINKFKEPQKYVGLRKLGGGDWD
jgi:cytochrome b involved in lipid metabolism